jgi:hypothetical protein
VHACSDAEIDSESETYIHDCMAITTWDINEGHNTIGLPKKSAYDRPEHSTMGTAEVPEGWDGLPCHMVEHNPTHTTEVVNWVKTNIWTKLKSAKNGERCEEVEQKRIHDMFKAGSDFFRKELTEIRGKREGGTKSVIDGGFKAEKWYEPFSMAEFPLSRPRPTQNPKGSLEQFLKEIF